MFQVGDFDEDKVTIRVEQNEFFCSRRKLSEHSPYFNAMFNGNFVEKNEKSVNIQQMKDNALRNILNIIDNKTDFINYEEILDTLQGACMLQFDTVKNYCINRLSDDLRIEYALQIWHTAEKLDLHPLCEKAKCKALIEFNILKDSESLLQLNIEELHLYLANNLLFCDNELDVFEAAMRWWYEFSKKIPPSENVNDQDEATKYLFLILNCIDFKVLTKGDVGHILTFPDVSNNTDISAVLRGVLALKIDPEAFLAEDVESQVKQLLYKNKKRSRFLFPCILTSEFAWEPDESKRMKNSLGREMNISYYDCKTRCMEKLFGPNTQFAKRCVAPLKGCKFVPYKENLLLVGGEYQYGKSNWNTNIWIYRTFKDQWEILTKIPQQRRHFNCCIVDDKLFIIGGTGKYRIVVNDSMFYYDLRTGEWTTDLQIPKSLFNIQICEYKNNLFIVPGNLRSAYGYLFDINNKRWTKLCITDPQNMAPDFQKRFIMYAKGNSIFIRGADLVELQLNSEDLEIKSCEEAAPIYGDKIGYYVHQNRLFLFVKHDAANFDKLYLLQCCNLDGSSKNIELLVQINDSIDTLWHINRGCFPFFHYSLTREMHCISEFDL